VSVALVIAIQDGNQLMIHHDRERHADAAGLLRAEQVRAHVAERAAEQSGCAVPLDPPPPPIFTPYRLRELVLPNRVVVSSMCQYRAEDGLRKALDSTGYPYELKPGDGAFYGPKIDFDVTDSIGRSWQLGTIQLDYNNPERFDLTYVGEEWTRGDYPRSFGFDPTGRFLYCCNQRADAVTIFAVARDTGGLSFTGKYVPVGNPSMIAFVDLA